MRFEDDSIQRPSCYQCSPVVEVVCVTPDARCCAMMQEQQEDDEASYQTPDEGDAQQQPQVFEDSDGKFSSHRSASGRLVDFVKSNSLRSVGCIQKAFTRAKHQPGQCVQELQKIVAARFDQHVTVVFK